MACEVVGLLRARPPIPRGSAAALCAVAADPESAGFDARLRAALETVTDWDQLSAAAARHGLAGLLSRRVTGACPEAVPAPVLALWRERAGVMAQRSLRMQRRLLTVLAALDEAGVPAMAFKGPALAEQLYGDSTLRAFVDLDLLVPMADVARAREAVLAIGYVEKHAVEAVPVEHLVEVMQEVVLVDPRGGPTVELHWREGPRFAAHSIAAEELARRRTEVTLLGSPVPAPCLADAVLLVAVHAATHDWWRLEDVAAFAAGLRRLSPLEQAALEARARGLSCARRLHVGVLLAVALADARPGRALWPAAHGDGAARRLAAFQGSRLVDAILLPAGEAGAAQARRRPGARAAEILREARGMDTCAATTSYVRRRLLTPGVNDWDGAAAAADASPARGPLAAARAAATQVRRQRRLWGATGRPRGVARSGAGKDRRRL